MSIYGRECRELNRGSTREEAWMDRFGNKYTMDELTDHYLLNILGLLCRGGGYVHFLTEERITNLFNEAARRGLHHDCHLDVALYHHREKEFFLKYFLNEGPS